MGCYAAAFLRWPAARASVLLALGIAFPAAVLAQGGGFTSSLSDPVTAASTPQDGFNATFNASTASLTNPSLHTGVSDPTHSQLLGSSLSPADYEAYQSSSPETAPRTGIQTDAQSTAGASDAFFGGRQNRSFSGAGSFVGGRQSARETAGVLSTEAALTGTLSAHAAFSGLGPASTTSQIGFSGQSVGLPAARTGPGAVQTLATTGSADQNSGYYAKDPVLTGSSSGFETGPELKGDMPSPSVETAAFFGGTGSTREQFQFDDGQTPPLSKPLTPGQILGVAPAYQAAAGGFPDSTKGLAGLPSEVELGISPFALSTNPDAPPFAPVSEGTVFAPKTQLSPNLHMQPLNPLGSFEVYERRLQAQRLTHGLSISEAAAAKQEDLRNFQRSRNRAGRRSTLTMPNQGVPGYQPELMGSPAIR